MPYFFATATTARMSVLLSSGFVGDSNQINFVFSVIAASKAAMSLIGIKVKLILLFFDIMFRKRLVVPPYKSS
jgi:hypothetical protein